MLALIAGQGRLPVLLARRLRQDGRAFRAFDLQGFPADPELGDRSVFRIEGLGTLLSDLAALGVTEAVFAGAIRRPPIDPAAIDAKTLPLLPAMMTALQSGDDAALRTVIRFFEEAGIAVLGADAIAPDLLPPEGVPTRARPGDSDRRDAERAAAIVAALGAVDVGQACVVSKGLALAVEALPGTDAMLAALAGRDGSEQGRAGLLFKAPKPGQDRRIDLPTIGPDTVTGAARAGLAGIVVAAGGVLVLDAAAVVGACDDAGLFLWVRPR